MKGASRVSGWGDPDGNACHHEARGTCSQEEGSLQSRYHKTITSMQNIDFNSYIYNFNP